jgi:hypothetical protein
VEEISIYLEWKIDEDAVNRQINLFGWRVYVTNQVSAHLTNLSALQERILILLGFDTTIYTQLDGQSFTPG